MSYLLLSFHYLKNLFELHQIIPLLMIDVFLLTFVEDNQLYDEIFVYSLLTSPYFE